MASTSQFLILCRSTVPLAIFALLALCNTQASNMPYIIESDVHKWALDFGKLLNNRSKTYSLYDDIKRDFIAGRGKVERKDGFALVREMTEDIESMVYSKIQAVKKIKEKAEKAMMSHKYDNEIGQTYTYNNARFLGNYNISGMELQQNKHFFNIPVNMFNSSIHVPINVYGNDSVVVNAIKWSENLYEAFESNHALDPSLSWQYFGSSTGFLRQYPATEWKTETTDTYDCRMRPWYIQAANSPKDMVILIDQSASMTGLRKEIAKHVALNILDTLSEDDHFNIYMFNNGVNSLVDCFNNSLVPANMENIREFKLSIQDTITKFIANFSAVLTTAFELLHHYNNTGRGSQCNQAIMLITDDGMPHIFEELFQRYNEPMNMVRLFTYFIGQEISNVDEVKAIACTNRGYYSHVSTIAEARDQVQKYVPVMARPLVLNQENITVWTSVYADVADPKESEWRWGRHVKARNRVRVVEAHDIINAKKENESMKLKYRLAYSKLQEDRAEDDFKLNEKLKIEDHNVVDDSGIKLYRLMTTVASPAFDRSEHPEIRANLAGVAGVDVPIEDITKLVPAYKLGVNAYSFAITNNGYIMFHPDLRPVYADSLKPDYNSVDITEVELRDDDLPPRVYNDELLQFREAMINRETNTSKMSLKIHMDGKKRVATRKYDYYYAPIKETPFSFGIALPEGYGMNKFTGEIDLRNVSIKYVMGQLEDTKWKIHPNWVYCSYIYPKKVEESFSFAYYPEINDLTPEENLRDTLEHAIQPGYKWDTNRFYQPTKDTSNYLDSEKIYCDAELVQSLLFDAEVTRSFTRLTKSGRIQPDIAEQLGIPMSFVATRSGLTRWEEYYEDIGISKFIEKNNKAIDEIWYKRATDFYYTAKDAFVFSVPHNDSNSYFKSNESYVTGARAIYLETKQLKAPAAVVGLNFEYSAFSQMFLDITSSCSTPNCAINCSSEMLDCYLLDDSGFIVVSEVTTNVGKFFGLIDGTVMNTFIEKEIYTKIHLVDTQSICLNETTISNTASRMLMQPIKLVGMALTWLWKQLTTLYTQTQLIYPWHAFGCAEKDDKGPFAQRLTIKKKSPMPCDKEYHLYQLQQKNLNNSVKIIQLPGCNSRDFCNSSLAVRLVPYTNLMLLVVDASCKCDVSPQISLELTQIKYNETRLCQILKWDSYRRRPSHCVNYHPLEEKIKVCSAGCPMEFTSPIIAFMLSMVAFDRII